MLVWRSAKGGVSRVAVKWYGGVWGDMETLLELLVFFGEDLELSLGVGHGSRGRMLKLRGGRGW
jgi:hypothetical protein